jgi:hypothetical protein
MAQPAKVQEPSMEEILASIRRIIADDEAKPPAAETPASPPAPAAKLERLVAAPPPVTAMKDIPPSKIPVAVAAAKAAAPALPPAPHPPAPPPAPVANNNQDEIDALLAGLDETTTPEEIRSPRPNEEVHKLTDNMAASAPPQTSFQRVAPHDDVEFAEASASRAAPPPAHDPPAPSPAILSQSTVVAVESAFKTLTNTVLSNQARTLEDLVKDMLRPMLKSWLDDNLPGLVERIVKAEIERVSRGR